MNQQQTIDKLREIYKGNRFEFEMQASVYLAGDHNQKLRQDIVFQVTGRTMPIKKCTHIAVADCLKNTFDQTTLF